MIYGAKLCARRVFGSMSLLGLILTFGATSNLFAQNAQRQVKPFLKSLESTPYHFDFIRAGLNSIHSVKFEDGVNNQYQTFFNRIIFQKSMNDGTGKILTYDKLSPIEFGTLAHESFHAFKANYIDVESRFEPLKKFVERRAQNLYRSVPEHKRAVTLEEAYASFIGWVLQAHEGTMRGFARLKPENCEHSLAGMERIWNGSWNSQVNGYWYRDSVGEYWADQFRGIGILIGEGMGAYKKFLNEENSVPVEEDLQDLDRRWVAYNVFEGTISPSFKDTFKEELAKAQCPSAEARESQD